MPKTACLLNICKLKRQTTTVRYSVAILCFGGSFSVMGPITEKLVSCLATQAHGQLPDEISPKLCVVVGRVMKYSRGHLAIPMGHRYYSDLLEINKKNMNEGQFQML